MDHFAQSESRAISINPPSRDEEYERELLERAIRNDSDIEYEREHDALELSLEYGW